MAALLDSFLDAPDYLDGSPWFPNPIICVRDMAITGTRETIDRLPLNGLGAWLNGTWYWMSRIHYNDPAAVLLPILLATGMTILRVFLNWIVFKRIPKWYKFTAEAEDKFPESIWKALYYTITWPWALYLVCGGKINIFFNLGSHWDAWSPSTLPLPGLYWLYMTQMGFYLHCTYASIYLETIRKDFGVLMTHHVLTLGLLFFSYMIRFHLVGLLLLFILDIGDVMLESSKTVVYFKDRGGKKNPKTEMLANVCFGIFTIQHVLCRLYWFPTKVMYSCMHISVTVFPGGPYYLLFVPMLWGLYAMQVYWFKFILKLLWKIFVLGQDLEDTREFDEEEEKRKKKLAQKQD